MICIRIMAMTWLSIAALASAAELPQQANTLCPVTAGEETEARFSTVYQGRTVYFCCGKCRAKFEADPAPYVSALQEIWAGSASASKHGPIKSLGRLHPVVVHFPVALILTAGLAEFGAVLLRKELWHAFGRFSITLGALGALLAAPLGWLAGGSPGLDALTEWHRWLGVATVEASLCAVFLSLTSFRTAYRVSLLISVLLVGATGHMGGLLVHGE